MKDFNIEPIDENAVKAAKDRWLKVAKPLFSLGTLENAITQIAGIRRTADFTFDKKALVVMCADNGVVAEGVTQSGQAITATVAKNFTLGKTSVCIMSKSAGVDVLPFDIGMVSDVDGVDKKYKVAYGTKNIAQQPAMTKIETISAIKAGIDIVKSLKNKGYDIVATGEMGIGNTTTSSAVTSVLLDASPEEITGRGAGLSTNGLEKKIEVIKQAIAVNKPDKSNAIDTLARVGGLDIAALCGVFLGGGIYHLPIVADGVISATAALVAVRLCPQVRDYILPSHISKEPAFQLLMQELELTPFINCGMFLGEGSGAVASIPLLKMAYDVYTEMSTFDNWGGNEKYKILE